MTPKKVYFYQLKIMHGVLDTQNKGVKLVQLHKEELLTMLTNIKNNCLDGDKERSSKIFLLPEDADKTTIEIFELEKNFLFGRIGKEEDINYLIQRNNKTLAGSNLPVDDNNHAEKCTYFYLDIEFGVISFISIQGAPSYRRLEDFLKAAIDDNSYSVSVCAVINENQLEVLYKKPRVCGLQAKVTVPPDDILGLDVMGLSQKDFEDLENVDHVSIALNVVAKRNKNVTVKGNHENGLIQMFEKIKEKCGKKLDVAKLKAGEIKEKNQEFDVFEQLITSNIDLPDLKGTINFLKDVKEAILKSYNSNKEVIITKLTK